MKLPIGIAALIAAFTTVAKASSACDMLPVSIIEKVQSAKLVNTKASVHDDGRLTASACYFQLDPAAQSVGLEVLSRARSDSIDPAEFWRSKFEQPRGMEAENDHEAERRQPPQKINGLGNDAYWVDTGRDGALYILTRGKIVRLSLGGKGSREEKKSRSLQLATAIVINGLP